MIAFDSNVFIYFLERNPDFFDTAARLLLPALVGDQPACTSVLTVTEIASKGGSAAVGMLDNSKIDVRPINLDIAKLAGAIRLKYQIKTPDAIHLASAIDAGAKTFYTNDLHLTKFGSIQKTAIRPLA